MSDIKIRPCPRCGDNPVMEEKKQYNKMVYKIQCKSCGLYTRQLWWSKEETIEAWNRRKSLRGRNE